MTVKCLVLAALAGLPTAMAAQAQDDVDYSLTAYLWLPDTRTEVATARGPAKAELSAKDALDALDFGFMLNGSARAGRWNLMGDIIHLDMSASSDTPFGVLFSELTTEAKLTAVSAYALYAVYETPQQLLELGGGLRAMSVDLDLTLAPGALPQRQFGVKDSWVDPVIAGRFTQRFADKWSASLAMDYGGFGGGSTSDETWQAVATLGYDFNEKWSVLASYRYLQVDHSKGGRDYRLEFSGPLIGVSYRF